MVLAVGALMAVRLQTYGAAPATGSRSPQLGERTDTMGSVSDTALPAAYRPIVAGGRAIFASDCAACHGERADGRGPMAATQIVPPRDFTDRGWMATHADGMFFTSVLRGVPGSSMPPFAGRLTERQIWAVVAYLRSLAPRRAVRPSARDLMTAGRRDLAAARDPVRAGAAIYSASCARCHGTDGGGDGPDAGRFAHAPRNLRNPGWMAARTDPQLRRVIRGGVDGTPMPGFPSLGAREVTALVAYLRHLSGTTPGPNPLGGEARTLYAAHCAECHGENGDGLAPGADQLAPSPRDFRDPAWMAAQTDSAIATAIAAGRPGTVMPPFRALLAPGEIALLVRYVRGFAAAIPASGVGTGYTGP